jgi:hypothetical protein
LTNKASKGRDDPPSLVTCGISDQLYVDYKARTGLSPRQLPADLREPADRFGHVNTCAAGFGAPAIAKSPAAWFIGTPAQIGADLGLSDRQTSRYFGANSMGWVSVHGGLCAATLTMLRLMREVLAANRNSTHSKRRNSAGTERDPSGRFSRQTEG